jgi:hypothetical protein
MMKWEAEDSAQRGDHARVCAAIDAANDQLRAAWESKTAAIAAEHQRACDEIARSNRQVMAAWNAENSSREGAYDRARREIERENQRLIAAWEADTANRQAEHALACREVDVKNRRIIDEWKVANAPWVAEEKRWRDRAERAMAEILRLESDLRRERQATESLLRKRHDEARGIAASHDRAKLDYERELRQAEVDSSKIQLEEHLDKASIRQAKLKGITGERILSLESFGIATAKDVALLNNQKVPGIGPVLSQRLFDWRASLVASFRPQQALPDSEKNRIASRYAPVMRPMVQSIEGAIHDLDTIATSHRTREAEMIKAIAAAVRNLAIAEAHVRAMKVG